MTLVCDTLTRSTPRIKMTQGYPQAALPLNRPATGASIPPSITPPPVSYPTVAIAQATATAHTNRFLGLQ